MAPPAPQNLQWTDILCCGVCGHLFDGTTHDPVTLQCGHSACRQCLAKLRSAQCPFDQSPLKTPPSKLLSNTALLRILRESGEPCPGSKEVAAELSSRIRSSLSASEAAECEKIVAAFEELAGYFRRAQSERGGSVWSPQLSRPMQRKIISLFSSQLLEPQGRSKALKAARYLGERSLTELLLLHQNPNHLSSNLWSAVRARGCQFLGPAMQEEVLRLILLTLSEGAMISRKTLVLYIVQTLGKDYPQASKTSVGHVVQLLYRASCFNVVKRNGESSLMQLKEEFRAYDLLRREHDSQIVHIAMESGLRISPDQWSALLYGDQSHRSHMQSIIDKLQSPQSFGLSVQELVITLQRVGDSDNLSRLVPHYEYLAGLDLVSESTEESVPSWVSLSAAIAATLAVVQGQVAFCLKYGNRVGGGRGGNIRGGYGPPSRVHGNSSSPPPPKPLSTPAGLEGMKCVDFAQSGGHCPRGQDCIFLHEKPEPSEMIQPPVAIAQPAAGARPSGGIVVNGVGMVPVPLPPAAAPAVPPPQQVFFQPAPLATAPPTIYVAAGAQPTFLTSQQTAYYPPTARFVLVHANEPVIQPIVPEPDFGYILSEFHHQRSNPPPPWRDAESAGAVKQREMELLQLSNKRDEILQRLETKERAVARRKKDYDTEAATLSFSVASSVLQDPVLDEEAKQSHGGKFQFDGARAAKTVEAGLNEYSRTDSGWCPFTASFPNWLPHLNSNGDFVNKPTTQGSSLPTTVICNDPTTVIKTSIPKPVSSPLVQSQQVPLASYEQVAPEEIVSQMPTVIRASKNVRPEDQVEQGLNRIVEVRESLGEIPSSFPITESTVEKEHLKWELYIVNQQIKKMGTDTEQKILEKELEFVETKISELELV